MAQYYKDRLPVARNDPSVVPAEASSSTLSEFDKLRKTLITDDAEEGWAAELRRYLGIMQWEVEKDTDIVEWWQVSLN
jgi:hypothetical protein